MVAFVADFGKNDYVSNTTSFVADFTGKDIAVGDWIVVTVTTTSSTATTFTLSGATSLFASGTGTTDNVQSQGWYIKITGSVPANLTVTATAGRQGTIAWVAWRDADPTTFLDTAVQVTSQSSTSSSNPSMPAITTVSANAVVAGGLSHGSSSTTVTLPSPWTTLVDGTRRNGLLFYRGVQASPGTVAAADFPLSASQQNRMFIYAVRSAVTATASLNWPVVGEQSDDGLLVNSYTTNATSVRLKVGTNSAVTTGVVYGGSETPDADGFASLEVTGLAALTDYWYRVEMTDASANVTESAIYGPVTTLPTPGTPHSFTIAFGSCHDLADGESASYARMAAHGPLLQFILGDLGYFDNTSTSQASHLSDLLGQINGSSGLRTNLGNIPTRYIKSDHDSGPNNSFPGSQTAPNRAAALQVFPYRDRPNSSGLYGSLVVGRVRFIFLDTRYFANPDGSTRLGSTQKAWLFAELVEPEPVKIIVNESLWIDNESGTGPGDDNWGAFPAEREEIGDFIVSDAVGEVRLISGDTHCLGADDGTNNDWGGFPTYTAAPFRNESSIKMENGALDFSEGTFPTTEGVNVQQYGLLEFTDDGTQIEVEFRGYDSTNTVRIQHATVTDTATPSEGVATLGFTFGITATGQREPEGSAVLGFSFGVTASGQREPEGAATLGLTFGVTASGQREPEGSAALGLSWAITTSGQREPVGSAVLGFSFGATANGATDPEGSAALGFAFGLVASGERESEGTATLGFEFDLDAVGGAASGGSATLGFSFGASASGQRHPEGSATLNHTWGVAASGTGERSGEATLGFTFGLSASGATDGGGSATFGHQWSLDASGETEPQGEATLGFSFGLGAQGEHDAQGSASLGFSFGIVAEGAREPKGLAILGFEFGADAQGSAPEPDMPEGSATFGHHWSLQADGENQYSGDAIFPFTFGLHAQGPQSNVDLPDILTLTVVEDILTLRAPNPGDPMACVDTMHEKRGDTRTRELVLNRDLTGVAPTDIQVFIAYRGTLVETLTPVIVDAPNGIIEITMSGTLEVAAYKLEVQVTQGSSITTHPTDGWISLIITQDLAD